MRSHHNQRGYLLITVIVSLFLLATVAVLLAHGSAIGARTANTELDSARAEYVAQAGMQHALWRAENNACMGNVTLPATTLGEDSYTATTTGAAAGTYYKLTADQDAWIRNDDVTGNNGTTVSNHIKQQAGMVEQVLTRFDVSALPAKAQINSATAWFHLMAGKVHVEGPVNVHEITADWAEKDVTWESFAGSYQAERIAMLPAQEAGDVWVAMNLTGLVQAWVNGQPNYGILFDTQAEGIHTEYTAREDGTNPPRLEVVVGSGPASPINIQATGILDNGVKRSLNRPVNLSVQPPNTFVLQPDGASGTDAYIWEYYKTTNFGNDDEVWVSLSNNNTSRSLFKFNLAGVPVGSKILSATLSLHHESGNNSNVPITAHRISKPWSEAFVTWNSRDNGINWNTAGGDFDAAVVATTDVGPATNIRYEWDIGSLVQDWIDGAPNYGVALATARNNSIGERFYTSDETDPTRRPRLTVTYACECGDACMAPQGSGIVTMAVINPTTLVPADAYKKALFESWGYTVNVISESENAAAYAAAAASSDVFFISETVNSNQLGSKLVSVSIGVVSQDGDYNSDLGFAGGSSWPVSPGINVTDASHYITAVFHAGPLDIYSGGMEQLTVSGGEAAELKTLADTGGAGSLVILDTGATMSGGGSAAGRRVMLPLGRDSSLNWNYLNNNGGLILQRSLAWAMGLGKTAPPGKKVLLVVGNAGSLTPEQADKKVLMEGWGHTITLIETSESQAAFDTAAALVDVVYVPELGTTPMNELDTKADDLAVGVITEESRRAIKLGGFVLLPFVDTTSINIVDNTHYLTETLPIGNVVLSTATQSFWKLGGTLAPDLHVLGELSGSAPGLAYVDIGETVNDGNPAPGRRVKLPWGAYEFDVNLLTDDGLEIMQRAIEWGASTVGGNGPYKVLFVVGSVGGAGPTAEEIVHQVLIESFGHTVELIDDDATEVEFDTAVANNDVAFATNDITASRLNTKLVDAVIGVVTSENNLSDEFGMASAIGWDSGTLVEINDNTHYITSPFSTGLLTILSASESLAYVTGTLSPDLGQLASSTSGYGIVTLEAGASMYGGGSAAGRRVQLPWGGTGFDPANLTPDGQTILQRAIEWGASAGDSPVLGPIAHWKLDDGVGTTAIDSEGGYDGTLLNGPVWVAGQLGDALEFDGVNDYVDLSAHLGSFSAITEGTISAWVRAETQRDQTIITLVDSTDSATYASFRLEETGSLHFAVRDGVTIFHVDSVATLSTGVWHHVAVTVSTSGNALYIDGAFSPANYIVGDASSTFFFDDVSAPDFMAIGQEKPSGGARFHFDGLIDDVRIYDRTLTEAEIAEIAAGGGGGGGGGGGSCDGNYLDQFEVYQFDNSDGTLDWSTSPWEEVGESDGPTAGDIRIWSDLDSVRLRTRDNDNGGEGIEREADLSGAASATLGYDYRRDKLDNSNDYTTVEVSPNGASGPWTELARYAGPTNDGAYVGANHDVSAFISVNTRIRFKTSSSMGNLDNVWFDNVEIACSP